MRTVSLKLDHRDVPTDAPSDSSVRKYEPRLAITPSEHGWLITLCGDWQLITDYRTCLPPVQVESP